MKNYIDCMQSQQPSPEQELRIYARFLEKRQRSLFLQRLKYYTKIAIYSVSLVMIIGSALFSFPQQSKDLYTRIISNRAVDVYTPNPWVVRADSIGKIVSLQWTAVIARDGKEFPLDDIYSDTTVVLKDGAVLTFQVAWWLQTQLIWPARFQLHRDEKQQIILDIHEGRMIQVESTQTSATDTATEMTIKTPQLQLAAIRSDKKIKLHIDSSTKNPVIANQGDAVTLKTTDAEQWVHVASLQSQQVVVINDAGKLEQEIISLGKKLVIADHVISFDEIFEVPGTGSAESESGNVNSGAILAVVDSKEDTKTFAIDSVPTSTQPITQTKEQPKDSLPTDLQTAEPEVAEGDALGSKDLLTQEDFSEFKLQLYAPNFHQALRSMLLAYARADYQTFLAQKKIVSPAISSLYDIVSFQPHIRVIASDPQVAVRQYQSLIDQLLLNINRSRGMSNMYVNKLMSIEVMFMLMRNIGYGKFIDSSLSDDELWKLIGDEVKKVTK
jgi:hypothetical protein